MRLAGPNGEHQSAEVVSEADRSPTVRPPISRKRTIIVNPCSKSGLTPLGRPMAPALREHRCNRPFDVVLEVLGGMGG